MLAISLSGFCSIAQADILPEIAIKDSAGNPVEYAVVLVPEISPQKNTVKPAIVDQVNEQFTPYVKVIAPNTEVLFPNSDDTRHHVYSFSKAKTFELKLYRANEAPPVLFDKQGLVKLGCNIHDHMRGYILVTEMQVYGISNKDGVAVLPAYQGMLPKNFYVWHPLLKERLSFDINKLAQATLNTSLELVLPITINTPAEMPKLDLRDRLKLFKQKS